MVYITGDTHGDFRRIQYFCKYAKTTKDDILVVLGDAGINIYGELTKHQIELLPFDDLIDTKIKSELQQLPITLLCIHGNHDIRPYHISTYNEITWRGSICYQENEYPNLLFAKDGEIYNLDGKRCMAIGGACSIPGIGHLPDEQPTNEIKKHVEKALDDCGYNIDVLFTHTCPYDYVPREQLIRGIKQWLMDTSTEKWLQSIENRLNYQSWYCGHFHTEKQKGKIQFVFRRFLELIAA